jgi:hypothetical protein
VQVGPLEVNSAQAQKALYLLRERQDLFDHTVEEDFQRLGCERQELETFIMAAAEKDAAGKTAPDSDEEVLRRRIIAVRLQDRLQAVRELMYLKVCNKFIKMQVPLIPTLKDVDEVRWDNESVNLKGLTEIFTSDVLEFVRVSIAEIIHENGVPYGAPEIMIARFQAGQIYGMAALFGYYIRNVGARFQLEKSFSAFGLEGTVPSADQGVSALVGGDERAVKALKDYVSSFSADDMQRMRHFESLEAQVAFHIQLSALFGDLKSLRQNLLRTVGPVSSDEEGAAKMQEVIRNRQVESVKLSSQDVHRLVAEAVAFGAFLRDVEKQADSLQAVTPIESLRPVPLP